MVLNVHQYFLALHPKWTMKKVASETANACSISVPSVYKIKKEMKETGFIRTPEKRDLQPKELGHENRSIMN
jgi:hypothetical protein